VSFWDERLSTVAETRTLLEADTSRKRRGELVAKMAAAFILQGALDRLQKLARDAEAAREDDPDQPLGQI
ncbi:MAG: RuvX/YqgF family protein, partial [Rhizobiales bacterium]|nr:RuvX/YqgF family protein [Hyphomicrobiales bacterium]